MRQRRGCLQRLQQWAKNKCKSPLSSLISFIHSLTHSLVIPQTLMEHLLGTGWALEYRSQRSDSHPRESHSQINYSKTTICRMGYQENKDVHNKVWLSVVCWIISFAPLNPLSTFIHSAIPWEAEFLRVHHWVPLPTDLQQSLASVAHQREKEEREAVKSVAFITIAVELPWAGFAQGQWSCWKVYFTQASLSPDSLFPLSTTSHIWWSIDFIAL